MVISGTLFRALFLKPEIMKTPDLIFDQTILPLIFEQNADVKVELFNNPKSRNLMFKDWIVLDDESNDLSFLKTSSNHFKFAVITKEFVECVNSIRCIQVGYKNNNSVVSFYCDFDFIAEDRKQKNEPGYETYYIYLKSNIALSKVSNYKGKISFTYNKLNKDVLLFTNQNGFKGRTWATPKGKIRFYLECRTLILGGQHHTNRGSLNEKYLLYENYILYPKNAVKYALDCLSIDDLKRLSSEENLIGSFYCGDFIQLKNSKLYIDINERLCFSKNHENKLDGHLVQLLEKAIYVFQEIDGKKFLCSNQTSGCKEGNNLFYYFESFYNISLSKENNQFQFFQELIKTFFSNTNIDRKLEHFNLNMNLYLNVFLLEKLSGLIQAKINSEDIYFKNIIFWQDSLDKICLAECDFHQTSVVLKEIGEIMRGFEYRRIPFLENRSIKDNPTDLALVLKRVKDVEIICLKISNINSVLHFKKLKLHNGFQLSVLLVNGDLLKILVLKGVEHRGFEIISKRKLFQMNTIYNGNYMELSSSEDQVLKLVMDSFCNGNVDSEIEFQELNNDLNLRALLNASWTLKLNDEKVMAEDFNALIIKKIIEQNSFRAIVGLDFCRRYLGCLWYNAKKIEQNEIKINELPLNFQNRIAMAIQGRQSAYDKQRPAKIYHFDQPESNLNLYEGFSLSNILSYMKVLFTRIKVLIAVNLCKIKGDFVIVIREPKVKKKTFSSSKYKQYKLYYYAMLTPKLNKIKLDLQNINLEKEYAKVAQDKIKSYNDPFLEKYFSNQL
jgi:hypothetical protein